MFKITCDDTFSMPSNFLCYSQTIPNAYSSRKRPHLNIIQSRPFFCNWINMNIRIYFNHFWYDYLITLDLCFRCSFFFVHSTYQQCYDVFSYSLGELQRNKKFQPKKKCWNCMLTASGLSLTYSNRNTFTWAEIGKVFFVEVFAIMMMIHQIMHVPY